MGFIGLGLGALASPLRLLAQVSRVKHVVDLHRVTARSDVVGHHAGFVAFDRRSHLVR